MHIFKRRENNHCLFHTFRHGLCKVEQTCFILSSFISSPHLDPIKGIAGKQNDHLMSSLDAKKIIWMQQEKLKGVVRNKNLKEWFSEKNLKGLYNIDGATKMQKAYNTRYSQAVSHPSTNRARCCLTSVIRREPVYSAWYGRRRKGAENNPS